MCLWRQPQKCKQLQKWIWPDKFGQSQDDLKNLDEDNKKIKSRKKNEDNLNLKTVPRMKMSYKIKTISRMKMTSKLRWPNK